MCDRKCFKCTYDDCINNSITDAERKEQNSYDMQNMRERIPEERANKGKLAQYDYNHSEKGKAARKRYEQSAKGKATQRRYEQSEKGKERDKRKQQKRIASGKNAEYCRAYYYRKKAEREATLCVS